MLDMRWIFNIRCMYYENIPCLRGNTSISLLSWIYPLPRQKVHQTFDVLQLQQQGMSRCCTAVSHMMALLPCSKETVKTLQYDWKRCNTPLLVYQAVHHVVTPKPPFLLISTSLHALAWLSDILGTSLAFLSPCQTPRTSPWPFFIWRTQA